MFQNVDKEENSSKSSSKIKTPPMLLVPAGKFLMGTSDDDIKRLQLKESEWAYDWYDNNLFDNEQPQHVVSLDEFEIAQYPVTNQEYHVFVWDMGYRLPKGWTGFTFPEDMDNHPITSISKIDAEAYIKWLNAKLGEHFRLPTEAEWERSARGVDGRIFPWGNTFDPWRCNTVESLKKTTTPVGSYSPSGDSICGAADMVGNVWEWTSTLFRPYPYRADDGREEKKPGERYVMRGGAWYYSRKLARCASREGMTENHISQATGFRLARTP